MIQSELLVCFFDCNKFYCCITFFIQKRKEKFDLYSLDTIIPLVFSIILNKAYFAEKGADALSRAETIILFSMMAQFQRLRYYEDVFKHFIKTQYLGQV